MRSWGKFWTKRYKDTKNTRLPHPKSQQQKPGVGSKSCVLRMPPAHNTTKGWAEHLSHLSSVPTTGHTPTLTLYKQPAHRPLGEQAREPVTCFCSLLQHRGPNKQTLAWISCPVSSQFLLIGEGQEPLSVSEVATMYLNIHHFSCKCVETKYWIQKTCYLMYKIQTTALRQAEKSEDLPLYRILLRNKVSHGELDKTEVI